MSIRLVTALSVLLLLGCSAPPDRPRGVVLVLLDTLRADHLGCYGYERPTSPRIDALAASGIRFEQAIATAPWTLPSVAALLAGQYAERVLDPEGDPAPSVMRALQDAGIRTAAFTEGGYVSRQLGLDAGFGEWREEEGAVQLRRAGEERDESPAGGIERTFADAEAWLTRNHGEPFFLFIHTYEPHTPYTNAEFARELGRGPVGETFTIPDVAALRQGALTLDEADVAYVTALYDGDIRTSDRRLGRFLDHLAALAIEDEVAVIVTSDHGEELGPRYRQNLFDHGHSLQDGLLHVPLVLHDPTSRHGAGVVREQVRTLDVMPTVAALLGVSLAEESYDGRSLLPLLAAPDAAQERLVFLGHTKAGPARVGMRTAGSKLIYAVPGSKADVPLAPRPPSLQLYDLDADPEELRNLMAERFELSQTLFELLRSRHPGWNRAAVPTHHEELDPELVERLESLGYAR